MEVDVYYQLWNKANSSINFLFLSCALPLSSGLTGTRIRKCCFIQTKMILFPTSHPNMMIKKWIYIENLLMINNPKVQTSWWFCGLSLYNCGMWIINYVKFASGMSGCTEGEFSPHIIQRWGKFLPIGFWAVSFISSRWHISNYLCTVHTFAWGVSAVRFTSNIRI